MYGSKRKRRLHSVAVLLGPLSFGLTILLLEWFFGFKAAAALGTTVWMALWWILRPVNISVTAFVPIGVNALFDLIPMQHVISQYFSEIIVLLFGADLVCLTWATTGLDKRLAIKTLCCIGTSLRQQIAVWLLVATVLSIFLPNVVVCTMAAAIAVPVVQSIAQALGLNPIPYLFVAIVAFNSAYVLPVSIRAIPVSYGLDPAELFKNGLLLSLCSVLLITVVGYLFIRYWPLFSTV